MKQYEDLAPPLRALEDTYELVRELGGTNATIVYLARIRASGRLVALKTLRAAHLRNSEAVARFRREARTMSALNHPNIVKTIAVEQLGERTAAIVMEYLEGGTLREVLRSQGALPFERVRGILTDVAEALRYAHGLGIIHRDVKPENIYVAVESGRAMLSDFGIARDMMLDTRLTLAGSAVGTPTYMSPEQIDGQTVDERSDVYSVGVLGWELLTGLKPWDGETLYGVIYKQKHEVLPPISSLRADTPHSLREAIEGAMQKDPAKRWANMGEMLACLRDESRDAAVLGSNDETLPTLAFQRADETLLGVKLPQPESGPPERATEPIVRATQPAERPVEREVRLQAARESVRPVSREPEVREVAQEPEVRRPRSTLSRRRLERRGVTRDADVEVAAASSAAMAANAAAQMASDAGESSAPVADDMVARSGAVAQLAQQLEENTTGSERRSALRADPAILGESGAPVRVPPPPRRNPWVIAIPSAVALAAAVFVLAGRGQERNRVEGMVTDTLVASTSGGAVDSGERVDARERKTRSGARPPTRASSRAAATRDAEVTRRAREPRTPVRAGNREIARANPPAPPPLRNQVPPAEPQRAPKPDERVVESAPLIDRIADNDVDLNRTYQQLIAALRRGSDAEPASVRELRAQQRSWLLQRDIACRAGTIDERANCFRDLSRNRAAELRARLEALPAVQRDTGSSPR